MAGRPKGSHEPVTLDNYLGLHHFAFLRSGAEGLDLADAAQRYMLGMERVDHGQGQSRAENAVLRGCDAPCTVISCGCDCVVI